jgi:hypothetical protein
MPEIYFGVKAWPAKPLKARILKLSPLEDGF